MLRKYKEALDDCLAALEREPTNAKVVTSEGPSRYHPRAPAQGTGRVAVGRGTGIGARGQELPAAGPAQRRAPHVRHRARAGPAQQHGARRGTAAPCPAAPSLFALTSCWAVGTGHRWQLESVSRIEDFEERARQAMQRKEYSHAAYNIEQGTTLPRPAPPCLAPPRDTLPRPTPSHPSSPQPSPCPAQPRPAPPSPNLPCLASTHSAPTRRAYPVPRLPVPSSSRPGAVLCPPANRQS